jgi:leucyl aminopeptidase
MTADFLIDAPDDAGVVPCDLWLVTAESWPETLAQFDVATRAWLAAIGFKADKQQLALIPGTDGALRGAVFGLGALDLLDDLDLWQVAGLPDRLPSGTRWRLAGPPLGPRAATGVALGWAYGSYRFES